jgi:hypothetical protein
MKSAKNTKVVVAAKSPVTTEKEIEVPASPASSELSTQVASDIKGEYVAADFGNPSWMSLISGTSKLAEFFKPGQFGLSNAIGSPVALGETIKIIPLTAALGYRMDFGQDDSGGAPVRFRTEQEVWNYGGTTTREPGKITFSRSMELRLLLDDTEQADSTYLRLKLGGKAYLVAIYEITRSAYRSVAVGLNLTWINGHETPHHRSWILSVKTQRNRQLNTNYFVPVLARGEETSAELRTEIRQMIDRQLPS